MRKETFEFYEFKGRKVLFTPARARYLEERGYIDFSEDIDFIDLNQIMTFDEYLSMLEENYDIKEQEMNMKMIR